MGPGRRTLRDTSRVLRCCFCLPGRSSVVKQMPLCYNTGTTLTNNRRSCVRVTLPAPGLARNARAFRGEGFFRSPCPIPEARWGWGPRAGAAGASRRPLPPRGAAAGLRPGAGPGPRPAASCRPLHFHKALVAGPVSWYTEKKNTGRNHYERAAAQRKPQGRRGIPPLL